MNNESQPVNGCSGMGQESRSRGRMAESLKLYSIKILPYSGSGGLVVRSRHRGRTAPGSKPKSAEDLPCMRTSEMKNGLKFCKTLSCFTNLDVYPEFESAEHKIYNIHTVLCDIQNIEATSWRYRKISYIAMFGGEEALSSSTPSTYRTPASKVYVHSLFEGIKSQYLSPRMIYFYLKQHCLHKTLIAEDYLTL
ncbi:hypothetical protein AVEN_63001-1 [Araneus ventricosus]|uniref:Uncharacterized protein n=1 Tax=Araneus ventricosus TaxID=182803 RepID=A0A4Y2CSU7_ARAVE|nr:hypothetical protein AVEN_63001-1 [Araneus ventricosus]